MVTSTGSECTQEGKAVPSARRMWLHQAGEGKWIQGLLFSNRVDPRGCTELGWQALCPARAEGSVCSGRRT